MCHQHRAIPNEEPVWLKQFGAFAWVVEQILNHAFQKILADCKQSQEVCPLAEGVLCL